MNVTKVWIILVATIFSATGINAQSQGNAQDQPSYRVTMVPRKILAINYQNRTKTEVGFQGSPLMPLAKGQAHVESRGGRIAIDAEFKDLDTATKFGREYLTYVLWAITPEGKPNNLGEILVAGGKSKLQVTTTLQTFGLIVTAEPYYAVSDPSDVVVLENVVQPGTTGTLQQVDVSYRLFKRGTYSYNVDAKYQSGPKSKVPLEVEEAENAVEIARNSGAPQYASDTFHKAERSLSSAEAMLRKGDRKVIVQNSRDAIQNAGEALQMTMERKADELQAQERADAARKTAQAQAEAEAASTRQEQEAIAREKAELEAQRSAQATAEAQAKSQQDAEAAAQAQRAAAQAQQAAAQSELEKQQLRATLLEQFNRILPTTDTDRGLKANLADVLFATGKFELQPAAREALARFSGIVLAHPGLKMQVEGYTDSTGTDVFNQTLSENRANSVRAFLVTQGLDPMSIGAVGYGKANPVDTNDTPAGRQQNRRVEIIISGEIIGTQIGAPAHRPQ
jgi:outer membrane protein OmpA-like peptidoglycan-associated protein